jgi:hypothetical protein
MKVGAVILVLIAHIITTPSFTSEIPLSSIYNIITCVMAVYRSTCVNILTYPTKTQGVFINLC